MSNPSPFSGPNYCNRHATAPGVQQIHKDGVQYIIYATQYYTHTCNNTQATRTLMPLPRCNCVWKIPPLPPTSVPLLHSTNGCKDALPAIPAARCASFVATLGYLWCTLCIKSVHICKPASTTHTKVHVISLVIAVLTAALQIWVVTAEKG